MADPWAGPYGPEAAQAPRLKGDDDDDDEDLTLCPHKDRVVIEQSPAGDEWWLTHKVTLAKRIFREPHYVAFDEHDGFGTLICTSSGRSILLEHYLWRHLYSSPTGELLVQDRRHKKWFSITEVKKSFLEVVCRGNK